MSQRAQSYAKRRRQIVAAAREIIMVHGVENLSMRKLAQCAGVSVTTLYNHFADKDALLQALIQESVAAVAPALHAQSTSEPLAALRNMAVVPVRHMVSHSALFRPVITAGYRAVSTRAAPAMVALYGRLIELIAGVIQAAQQSGDLLDDLEPGVLAAEVFYTYRLALEDWACGEIGDDALERRVRFGSLLILSGAAGEDARRVLHGELAGVQAEVGGDLHARFGAISAGPAETGEDLN